MSASTAPAPLRALPSELPTPTDHADPTDPCDLPSLPPLQYRTIHGYRRAFRMAGQGPAIVFAHGLGGNHLSWWQQLAHFAPRYTCVAFSHRGFPPSSPVPGERAPDRYADDLAALATLYVPNLTPGGRLRAWTDGEIIRAMREGVDRKGNALFPIMPYSDLRTLSDEDAQSMVAYLRTLRPIRYQEPEKNLELPLPIVEKFVPRPLEGPVNAPDRTDSVAYGRYLTRSPLEVDHAV